MKCTSCNHEVNETTQKCPFCGYELEKTKTKIKAICNFCGAYMDYKAITCPNCGKKHAMSASAGLKLGIGLFLLMIFAPSILGFLTILFGLVTSSKILSINEIITIAKIIIYIIICIPLFIAVLGYTGKILKDSTKKDTICLILSIISIGGLICFTTFTKNYKVKFENYDKQEYITLHNISVPTLYKVTKYNNTFLAMKLKEFEDGIEAEEITIQTKEAIPQNILQNYKSKLLINGFAYLGIVDGETEAYIYFENNYYMLVGFINDNKNIIYLSFDQDNYNKFLNSVKITKE